MRVVDLQCLVIAIAVGSIGATSGCFDPDYPEGRACAENNECPGNLVCQLPDLVCVSAASGPPADTGQTVILPSSADFGPVVIGVSSAALEFQLVSTGNITKPTVTVSGPFAITADDCGDKDLIEGQICTVSVRFEPDAAGASGGMLTGVGGDAPMSGVGLVAGALVFTPATIEFPEITTGMMSAESLVTLANTGGEELADVTVALESSDTFSISSTTCPAVLAAGAECDVGVTFEASNAQAGAHVTSLSASALGATGTLQAAASLSGSAVLVTYPVTVAVNSGFDGDRIVVADHGIDCNKDGLSVCMASIPTGTVVLFERVNASGQNFVWLGDCQGLGMVASCTLTIEAQTAVSGTFFTIPPF